MKLFLTGAAEFVGSALLHRLVSNAVVLKILVRDQLVGLPSDVIQVVGDLSGVLNYHVPSAADDKKDSKSCDDILRDIDTVVHLAARAHIMLEELVDPLVEYRRVNRDATLALARLAAQAGVKRFVFVSSIGVNGNLSSYPFSETDKPRPHDAYSLSKYEAEQGLLAMAKTTDMDVVIIRPPLVYGANAPGNFGNLVRGVKKGVPLPFGVVPNARSLVALDNLVDFIMLCADPACSPKAANEVFLISDGEDVSTSDLLRKVAKACGVKSRLLPVPVGLMRFAARVLGKGALTDRVFGNLQVDSSKARDLLGWKPVVTMDEALAQMFNA